MIIHVLMSKRPKLRTMFLFAMLALVFSCRSNDDVAGGDKHASLKLNLQGVDYSGVQNLMANGAGRVASVSRKTSVPSMEQKVEIPFNDDFKVIATLKPAGSSVKKTVVAAVGSGALSNPGPQPLVIGTKYKMIIYGADGTWLGERNYIYGQELPEEGSEFAVNVGETLTFVLLSANSQTNKPTLIPSRGSYTYQDIQVDRADYDLLLFQKTITIKEGTNYLDVIFKHAFSEITTTINTAAIGNITSISDGVITPSYTSANIKISDYFNANGTVNSDNIIWNGASSDAKVQFDGVFPGTVAKAKTLLLSNKVTTGELIIPSLTINGVTKTNFKASGSTGFKITPGVRYDLNLVLAPASGIDVGGDIIWAPANLVYNNGVYEFAASPSDFGDHWYFNAVKPLETAKEITEAYLLPKEVTGASVYNASEDPCTKVTAKGGGWRLPTQQEVVDSAGKNVFTFPGYYNGVKGIFVGTDTQPAPADYDKYLFLPLAGFGNTYNAVRNSVEARYWTSTEYSAENFYDFSFNNGGVTLGNGQYYRYGESIRCVKRK
ncbi:hypothetical protein [Elizabethkingia meningoseptica]|uniref:hypothetical protein n=2 Tax=Elizabethkingia meningoseptica TaxID=238 RepID=UPI0023B1D7EE|nr:hypothetical protein [Elizabethkingia meningoseptica]